MWLCAVTHYGQNLLYMHGMHCGQWTCILGPGLSTHIHVLCCYAVSGRT
jgi:hypothetical protein